MSISGSVTLAATRSSLPRQRNVTRSDLGKGTAAKGQGDAANVGDIVSTLVPTGFVAPYTAAITAVAGIAKKPTAEMPDPDLYIGWRVGTFIALLVLTIVFLIAGYYRQDPENRRFPLLEAIGALVAAAAWGMATPESFLYAMLEEPMRALVPVLIGAGGAGLLFALGVPLKKGTGGNS